MRWWRTSINYSDVGANAILVVIASTGSNANSSSAGSVGEFVSGTNTGTRGIINPCSFGAGATLFVQTSGS